MKKIMSCILAFLIVLSLPKSVFAEVDLLEKTADLSSAEKTILSILIGEAIQRKYNEDPGEYYTPILNEDLMDYSIEELEQIKAMLQSEPKRDDPLEGLDITPCSEKFANEKDLQFSLFKSVYEATGQLDWLVSPLVTRDGNPELSFDSKNQEIKYARFYLSYYGNVDKDEARGNVEEYTDRLAAVLSALYPNISADMVCFFWKIPVINKDSLYSASFFYHTEGGVLVSNDE